MLGLETVAAALSYIALALLLGQLVAAGFLLPDGESKELRDSLLTGARSAVLIFLAVAFFALVLQGAKLQRGFPSAELLWRYLTMAQSGNIGLARELYGATLAIFVWTLASRDASCKLIRCAAIFAIPLLASRSLTSHAVAVREDTLLTVIADAIHLIATALWGGGLIALWRVLYLAAKEWQQPLAWTAAIVQRFSRLALISVTVLVLTGFYQSWIHVGGLTALVNTDYGRTLVLKLLLFSVMLSVGALNSLSTTRLLKRAAIENENDAAVGQKALRRIGFESVIALLIFCATGLLTVLPPGIHAVHQIATAAPPAPARTDASKEKTYFPAEGASVKILSPRAGQVVGGDGLPVRFNLFAGKRGHHAHAYVDGELTGMFESDKGTLNGIKSGKHVLELRVVANDHTTELDASDKVEFTVK